MKEKNFSPLDRDEELDILFGVINRFIGYFTRDSIKQTQNDTKSEYPFVPMDTRQAYEQILCAKNYLDASSIDNQSDYSFIDVGCGIGQIMILAEMAGFNAFGIEKDPYPCKIAQKLMGTDKVSQADIWDYDGYGDFDVVYYFRPFSTKKLQGRFEKLIEDKVKVGGLIIANRRLSDSIERDSRFKKIDPKWPIWVKIGEI